MKITTRDTVKPTGLKKPSGGGKPVRYFKNTELLFGALFFGFIIASANFFISKQNQISNITDLGIVQSVSAPDWSAGTVTVITDKMTFKGRPYYKIAAGNDLQLKEFHSGEKKLCIKNVAIPCIALSNDDARYITPPL
ncbi:hypothetical protein ACI0X9_003284 [Cronobacter turicensis]